MMSGEVIRLDDHAARRTHGTDSRTAGAPLGAPARIRAARRDTTAADEVPNGRTGGPDAAPEPEAPDHWDQRVARLLRFTRRRLTGEYPVDGFGFDADLADTALLPPLRLLYRHWFRVEVSGIENVPTEGSALLVANHSGTIALDALMLGVAVHDEHPARRHLRLLGADFVFSTPLLAELARKAGATLACTQDAERLLRSGELVGVFPEGFKGVGKPFSERYKLQRFGRGGFVSAALRTRTPIVPVSIVGAEETYPLIGNIKPLARLLGLPYFPVTPLFPWFGPLGMVPLPSKWLIEFGEPIHTADLDASADDPMAVFNLADQVRETIQQTLYQVLLRRNGVFG
jgi:1-acyl-sn-glycerol-3-phosphate acyltransferase